MAKKLITEADGSVSYREDRKNQYEGDNYQGIGYDGDGFDYIDDDEDEQYMRSGYMQMAKEKYSSVSKNDKDKKNRRRLELEDIIQDLELDLKAIKDDTSLSSYDKKSELRLLNKKLAKYEKEYDDLENELFGEKYSFKEEDLEDLEDEDLEDEDLEDEDLEDEGLEDEDLEDLEDLEAELEEIEDDIQSLKDFVGYEESFKKKRR